MAEHFPAVNLERGVGIHAHREGGVNRDTPSGGYGFKSHWWSLYSGIAQTGRAPDFSDPPAMGGFVLGAGSPYIMIEVDMHKTTATAAEVEGCLDKIFPAVAEEDPRVLLLSVLSIAFILQHPDIEPDQLTMGVKGASEWIALYLSTLSETGALPPEKLN